MKILHISPFFPPNVTGGAELYAAHLAKAQVNRGHQVSVATIGRDDQPPEERGGITVHTMKYWTNIWPGDAPSKYNRYYRALSAAIRPFNLRAFLRFDRIVRKVRPDVVNAHSLTGISASMWLSPALRGIPLVHTLHDFGFYCGRSNIFRDRNICAAVCTNCRIATESNRAFGRSVNAIVGVGQDILDRHTALGRFQHIPSAFRRVIGNPIEFDQLQNTPKRQDRTGPFTFGFLGRLVPEKGIVAILEACARLPVDLNWTLQIAGSDTGEIDLGAAMARFLDGRVSYHGWVKPTLFLSNIDVLLAPSEWAEPFGRTVIEAYHQNIPVVGTRVGGLKDLIEEGSTGWFVEPNNFDELTHLMLRLIKGGRPALPPAENFTAMTVRYRPEAIAADYDDLYNALIAGKAAF